MAGIDDEDFGSDSSDDDYAPSDGEAGSGEEEESGEEETLAFLDGDVELTKSSRRKGKAGAKDSTRKRKGGIKLDDEEGDTAEKGTEDDSFSKELAQQIQNEKTEKKQVEEKKKADSLWADFMSDVGGPKPKAKPSGSGLGNLSSLAKPSPSKAAPDPKPEPSSSNKPKPGLIGKVTITKEYDFAGETIKVTKEVDADSKEAKAELQKTAPEEEKKPKMSSGPSIPGLSGLGKRPAGGLGNVLGMIGKKPKMGTLDKSKLDWESFKKDQKIDEELKIHNRGKDGYLEQQDFLNRTDQRQFEKERDVRLGVRPSKR